MPKDGDFTHNDYMDICIAILCKCDSIAMLPGWDCSFGSVAEWGVAIGKDMKVIEVKKEDILPPEEPVPEPKIIRDPTPCGPFPVGSPEAAAAIERVRKREAERERDAAGFQAGKKRGRKKKEES